MLAAHSNLRLTLALEAADCDSLGRDSGQLAGCGSNGVVLTAAAERVAADACDVLIDFSIAAAVADHIDLCLAANWGLVLGTTGLSAAVTEKLQTASLSIPILSSPNMSTGVAVCMQLLSAAARALDEDWDIEISECHHRYKRDAPSGTALRMAEVIARGRCRPLDEVAVYGRRGTDTARSRGEIGFSVLRGGDLTGNHSVLFATAGECIEISHRTNSRRAFVQGALRAAEWLFGKPPGLYSLNDSLSIKDSANIVADNGSPTATES